MPFSLSKSVWTVSAGAVAIVVAGIQDPEARNGQADQSAQSQRISAEDRSGGT
jgi:hypothetical protein